jgi:hypothetical protein
MITFICILLGLYALALLHPMSIPIFVWYDLWIGFFWNKDKRRLYFFPLPCIGLYVNFPAKVYEDFTEDPEYAAYVERCAQHCVCPEILRPCEGCLAGGICDGTDPDLYQHDWTEHEDHPHCP